MSVIKTGHTSSIKWITLLVVSAVGIVGAHEALPSGKFTVESDRTVIIAWRADIISADWSGRGFSTVRIIETVYTFVRSGLAIERFDSTTM